MRLSEAVSVSGELIYVDMDAPLSIWDRLDLLLANGLIHWVIIIGGIALWVYLWRRIHGGWS
ncbi:MAG: hypothetical protein V3W44_05135 [Dehalococcoidales bacterium]